ncbi:hypothetical protein TSOC_009629 [Tetrabaena socialis]|uniref:Apple domain-containing protein n=1 Tax=Tetrabaena socialis TaxID=47790 RepID=A0A2J7ZVD6_9CHLO|nr:hypothetical protein TSOC_009629 [Tetrabaena socialis]|eukprot:PNH04247.1 hypothetical protein TSOC_009629 [Tetrabaena socialis]
MMHLCGIQDMRLTHLSGYIVTVDMDHLHDNIGRASSFANASKECNADKSCRGFNSGGWYKRVASPVRTSKGMCFYTKGSSR